MSQFKMTDEQFNRLVRMNFGVAPAWCKGAIATNSGWVNPRTKEVLFASAGLARRIQEFEAEKARRAAAKDTSAPAKEPAAEPVHAAKKVVQPAPVVEKKEEPKVEVKAESTEPKRWFDALAIDVEEVEEPKVEAKEENEAPKVSEKKSKGKGKKSKE